MFVIEMNIFMQPKFSSETNMFELIINWYKKRKIHEICVAQWPQAPRMINTVIFVTNIIGAHPEFSEKSDRNFLNQFHCLWTLTDSSNKLFGSKHNEWERQTKI